MEEWRVIAMFPDYAVSNYGNIKRMVESRTGGRHVGYVKKSHLGDRGYLRVTLYKGSFHKTRDIHALVLEAFSGPRVGNMEPHHKDGNKTNNNISNLEWVTPSKNIACNYSLGLRLPTDLKGEEIGNSRFKEGEIYLIKKMLASKKIPQIMIAKMFKTKQSYISAINRGTSWKHIVCEGFRPSPKGKRFTEGEIFLIRRILESKKFSNRFIAKMFRVAPPKISQIKLGQRY